MKREKAMDYENYLICELMNDPELIDLYVDLVAGIEVDKEDYRFSILQLERLKKIGLTDEFVEKAISLTLKNKIGGNKK